MLYNYLILFMLLAVGLESHAQRKTNYITANRLDSVRVNKSKYFETDSNKRKPLKPKSIFFSRGEINLEGMSISDVRPNDFSPQEWIKVNAQQSFSIKGLPIKASLTLSSENSRFNRINSFSLDFDYQALRDSLEVRRRQKEQQLREQWTKSKAEKNSLIDKRKELLEKIKKNESQIKGIKEYNNKIELPEKIDSSFSPSIIDTITKSKAFNDSIFLAKQQVDVALNKWLKEKHDDLQQLKAQEELYNSQIKNLDLQGQLDSLQMEAQSADLTTRNLAKQALDKHGNSDRWLSQLEIKKLGLGMITPDISSLSVQNITLNGGELELGINHWRIGSFAGKTGGNRGFINPIRPIPFTLNQWTMGLYGGYKSEKNQLTGLFAFADGQPMGNSDASAWSSGSLWNAITAIFGKKAFSHLFEIEAELVHSGIEKDYSAWISGALHQYTQFRNYAGRVAFRTSKIGGVEINGQLMQINPGFINRINGLLRRDIRQTDFALEKVWFNRVKTKVGFRRLEYDVLNEGNVGRNIQSAKIQIGTLFKKLPNVTLAYTPYTTLNQIDGKQYWADINNWLFKIHYQRKFKKWRINAIMQYAGNETIMDTLSSTSSQGFIQVGVIRSNGLTGSLSYSVSQFQPSSDSSRSDGLTFQLGVPVKRVLQVNFSVQSSMLQSANSFQGVGVSLAWNWSKKGSLQYAWQWNQWSTRQVNQNFEHRLRWSLLW